MSNGGSQLSSRRPHVFHHTTGLTGNTHSTSDPITTDNHITIKSRNYRFICSVIADGYYRQYEFRFNQAIRQDG